MRRKPPEEYIRFQPEAAFAHETLRSLLSRPVWLLASSPLNQTRIAATAPIR